MTLVDGGNTTDELSELAQTVRGSFSTVEHMTTAFLREAILRGIYKPGERLQQDTIAQVLGVSRMPVRASLRELQHEGLITVHPHRGATVTSLRPEQVAEVYELRILLETYLLRKALDNIQDEDIERLGQYIERLEKASEEYEWEAVRQELYSTLYGLAQRPHAYQVVLRLRTRVGPHLLHRRVVEDPASHLGILEYLRARDADGAERWLTEHLQAVSARLQGLVEEELPGDTSSG